MTYDSSFLANRHDMKIKEIFGKKFFQILYPMIEKFYSKLILIFFPDEFTPLDEMTDNKYSSRF